MIKINLEGPDGNAYALLSTAKQISRNLEWTNPEIEKVQKEMTAGDYSNLLDIFSYYYGEYVKLVGRDQF